MRASGSMSAAERIVLTGFMGSGKTTVGRQLAAQLGWAFLDLDEEIAQRTGLSVPDIFAQRGELYFRDEERLTLLACLARSQVVIAPGGGAIETKANRLALKAALRTTVVYLAGDFDLLHGRCYAENRTAGSIVRPLMVDAAVALQRYARRLPLYREVATLELDACACSAETLAQRLAEIFRHGLHRQ